MPLAIAVAVVAFMIIWVSTTKDIDELTELGGDASMDEFVASIVP